MDLIENSIKLRNTDIQNFVAMTLNRDGIEDINELCAYWQFQDEGDPEKEWKNYSLEICMLLNVQSFKYSIEKNADYQRVKIKPRHVVDLEEMAEI